MYLKFNLEYINYCSKWLYAIKSFSHTLTFLSSMLNPFLYTIIGNNFRKQVNSTRQKYASKFKSIREKENNEISNANSRKGSNVKKSFLRNDETNKAISLLVADYCEN